MFGVRVAQGAVPEAARLEPQPFSLASLDLLLLPAGELEQGLGAIGHEDVRLLELVRRVAAQPREDPPLLQQRVKDFLVPAAEVDAPLELVQGELQVSHLVVRARQVEGHARVVGRLDFFGLQDADVKVPPALLGFGVENASVHKAHRKGFARHDDVLSCVVRSEGRDLVDGVVVVPALQLSQRVLRRREHDLHLHRHVVRLPHHAHAFAAGVRAPVATLLFEAPGDRPQAPHVFKGKIGIWHERVGGASAVGLERVVPGRRKVDKRLFDQLTGNVREVSSHDVLRAVGRARVHDRPVVDVRRRGAHGLSHRACFVLDDHREPQRGAVCVVGQNSRRMLHGFPEAAVLAGASGLASCRR